MTGGGLSRLRQILWVGAGVALLSLVVVAGSWLFSPRPEPGKPDGAPFQVTEQSVQRNSFRTEGTARPGQRFTPEPGARTTPATTARPPAPGTTVETLDETPSAAPAEQPRVIPSPSSPVPREVQPPLAKPEPPQAPVAAPASPAIPKGAFGIQVGAFSSASNVEAAKKKLESMGYQVATIRSGNAIKVIASGFSSRTSAEEALQAVRAGGYSGAFVLPLE